MNKDKQISENRQKEIFFRLTNSLKFSYTYIATFCRSKRFRYKNGRIRTRMDTFFIQSKEYFGNRGCCARGLQLRVWSRCQTITITMLTPLITKSSNDNYTHIYGLTCYYCDNKYYIIFLQFLIRLCMHVVFDNFTKLILLKDCTVQLTIFPRKRCY